MRFACYKVRPQCHRLYRFLCTLQLDTIPHCPKCLHVPGLIHQSPIHRVSLLHRHRLHHGHQDHSHLEDRAAVRQMLEEVKVVEVAGESLEMQAGWQHVGYLTLRAVVTRMEKTVWPKHKVGCEVDKISLLSSTKWKSVAEFSRDTAPRNGWCPTRIIPSQFYFQVWWQLWTQAHPKHLCRRPYLSRGNKEVQTQVWKDLKFRVKIDPEQ